MLRLAAILTLVLAGTVRADDWPAWRGPTGQGFCIEKNIPVTWSKNTNVKWKVPLEHQGNSTPVIWGDKIFLTQANKGGGIRSLLCFARADGKMLWKKDVAYNDSERNWNANWYANASPVVDGERVVACFASAGLYCFDFDGKELWKRTDLGNWQHQFGNGASPILYGDLAIQWCGPNEGKGRNFLIAVNKKTGVTVWEHDEKTGSWATPVVAKIEGQDQMLLGAGSKLKSFDPKTGKELWLCSGLTGYVYTSALYGNGVAVAMCGFYGASMAVKVGGTGDISGNRLWRHPKNIQRVGSGMIIGDHIYMVDENGTPRCYEPTTGKELWQVKERPTGMTWGSMVHAEGRLYILMRGGETLVLKASPKYEVIGINHLEPGEQTNSSLAISNGEIYIRTFRHLWCISEKK